VPTTPTSGGHLRIGPIGAVSPSLAEVLRSCKLRAGLSRTQRAAEFVLGNPKGWLGTAYHEVMAAAASHTGEPLDSVVSAVWDEAIARAYERAKAHPLDRRFGEPETWPGYHLTAAMARVRAEELARGKSRTEGCGDNSRAKAERYREQKFSGAAGKLVGRPDLVRAGVIIDFKSGSVHEDGEEEEVRLSYIRQLMIYAVLVKETLGSWPEKGVLIPMVGSPVEVKLDPEACQQEAGDAIGLLDDYNGLVSRATDISLLASPSPRACRWCPFQTICPVFWQSVAPDWVEELRTAAVGGTAREAPRAIHSGAALSLVVDVQSGTERDQKILQLAPIDPQTQHDVTHINGGDVLRATGLLRRPDRTLRITQRTVLAAVRNLPMLEVA